MDHTEKCEFEMENMGLLFFFVCGFFYFTGLKKKGSKEGEQCGRP